MAAARTSAFRLLLSPGIHESIAVEIQEGRGKNVRALLEMTQPCVTGCAKQTAYLARVMIVVDAPATTAARIGGVTDRAPASLRDDHLVELFLCESVLLQRVSALTRNRPRAFLALHTAVDGPSVTFHRNLRATERTRPTMPSLTRYGTALSTPHLVVVIPTQASPDSGPVASALRADARPLPNVVRRSGTPPCLVVATTPSPCQNPRPTALDGTPFVHARTLSRLGL